MVSCSYLLTVVVGSGVEEDLLEPLDLGTKDLTRDEGISLNNNRNGIEALKERMRREFNQIAYLYCFFSSFPSASGIPIAYSMILLVM